MDLVVSIIVILVGAVVVIATGILGKGIGFGSSGKFILDKFGPGAARILGAVVGLAIVALGVLMLFHPEWFSMRK